MVGGTSGEEGSGWKENNNQIVKILDQHRISQSRNMKLRIEGSKE
jgi:hypothetical protein